MSTRPNLLKSPKTMAFVTVLAILLFPGLLPVSGQEASTHDVRASPLPELSATLAERSPSVRSLVLARGNCVAFEYYRKNIDAETQSPVHSVTKSVLSILVGIAIDEGHLRLDEKLPEVFPEEFDEKVDPLTRNITIRDLLTKTEGFAEASEGDFKIGVGVGGKPQIWRWMLNRSMKYPPGTHFRYDEVGSDLLSVVLSHATMKNTAAFAKDKLFDPLHIVNYTWYRDTEGYLHGESGLHLTARDMAKIGILFLQHGRWGGAQIVSEAYVRDATSKHNDGGPPVRTPYGYQWWVNDTGNDRAAFFASGRNGQSISVFPRQELVIAVAADSIPGGSRKFINTVVLPAAAELSGQPPCVVRYGQRSQPK